MLNLVPLQNPPACLTLEGRKQVYLGGEVGAVLQGPKRAQADERCCTQTACVYKLASISFISQSIHQSINRSNSRFIFHPIHQSFAHPSSTNPSHSIPKHHNGQQDHRPPRRRLSCGFRRCRPPRRRRPRLERLEIHHSLCPHHHLHHRVQHSILYGLQHHGGILHRHSPHDCL